MTKKKQTPPALPRVVVDATVESGELKREANDDGPRVFAWYWVRSEQDWEVKKYGGEWLGCAMKVGSNFIEVHSPLGVWDRIHIEQFWERCRLEPDPMKHIRNAIAGHASRAEALIHEVRELTARLGMSMEQQAATPSSGALVALNAARNVKEYESALILAKEKQLPELFKAIQEEHANLATWMKAETLPLQAQVDLMKTHVATIDDRIFSISLYAGLTENVARVRDGKPAEKAAKLHVMQRMLFMDEECLLDYKHGGMDFKSLRAFDKWIGKEKNLQRILPHDRCLVAMRVRRTSKERDWEGSLTTALINLRLEEADHMTFLYVRNGKQLYRLNCSMDFGELIFPDDRVFNPLEPKMVQVEGSRVRDDKDAFISVHEYERRVQARKDLERKRKAVG